VDETHSSDESPSPETGRDKALKTVIERWSSDTSEDFSQAVYWLANPIVARRYQNRAVGDSQATHWVDFCAGRFLSELPVNRILSVGCGEGGLERHLQGLLPATLIEGIDISPTRIDSARQAAAEAGMSAIRYFVGDAEDMPLLPSRYGAIIFDASLHHVFDVRGLLERVATALGPGGILVVNEYVGPNRFALSSREREVLEAAWRLLPEAFRRSCATVNRGELQHAPAYPDPAEVEQVDPSECVQSEQIMPTLRERFEILHYADRGGSLVHFLLANIAGNFREDNPRAVRLLEVMFDLEDVLVESGDLGVHFALAIARPRSGR